MAKTHQEHIAVVVALLGPAMAPPFVDWFADQGSDLPWDQRRKVQLATAEESSVSEIIDLASGQLAVNLTDEFAGRVSDVIAEVDFFRDGDEEEYQPRHPPQRLACVTREGSLYWPRWREAPIGDLVRAQHAGVADGDPKRIYLKPQPPGSDFGAAEWNALQEALGQVWIYLVAPGALYSSAQALAAIRRRIAAARETIGQHFQDWSDRSGGPDEIGRALSEGASAHDLAKLLQVPETELDALTLALRRSESRSKPEEALVGQLLELASWGNVGLHSGKGMEEFATKQATLWARACIEAYLAGGVVTVPNAHDVISMSRSSLSSKRRFRRGR